MSKSFAMTKNIAFIPIRKGSKGIPNKNIRILGGKPLVCWVIDTLLSLPEIGRIWVSTDSEDAKKILLSRYGDKVGIFDRNPQNAGDTSPVIDAVIELIKSLNIAPDRKLILVQATSPFTSKDDFLKLLKTLRQDNADSYLSCRRLKRFVWSEDGVPISYAMESKPMRQDYPGILIETGAFYASKVENILNSGQLLSGRIRIIETGPGTAIDIDEESDWKDAEKYINNFGDGK